MAFPSFMIIFITLFSFIQILDASPYHFNSWIAQPTSRGRHVLSQSRKSPVLEPYLKLFFPNISLPVSLPFALQKDDLLVYLHMPKTGGQTFHRVLVNSFKGCDLNNASCYPDYDEDKPEPPGSPVSDRMDLTFASPPKFEAMLANDSGVSDFFAPFHAGLGHVDMSIVTRIPDRRIVFITMLREPLSRLDSLFDYLSLAAKHVVECIGAMNKGLIAYANKQGPATSDDPYLEKICSAPMIRRMAADNISLALHHRMIKDQFSWNVQHHSRSLPFIMGPTCLPPDLTFEQFTDTLREIEFDNFMARSLTGTTTRSLLKNRPHLSPAQTLELAKQVLKSFPFVGLQERFADSIELFLWTFGFPEGQLDPRRIYNKSEKKMDAQKLIDLNARGMDYLDVQLYEFGVSLFEERFNQMRRHKQANKQNTEAKK